MSNTVRYVAVMEGEEGRRGTSRPLLIASDPATVEEVVRIIGEGVGGWRPSADADRNDRGERHEPS